MAFELEIAPIPMPPLCCRSPTWADETWKKRRRQLLSLAQSLLTREASQRRPGPATIPQPLLAEALGENRPPPPPPQPKVAQQRLCTEEKQDRRNSSSRALQEVFHKSTEVILASN